MEQMQYLEGIRVPRCLVPHSDDRQFSELHVLCDASEEAFATVLYIRNTDLAGTYLSSNLVISKTRVAPRKTISVAKMELQAALLAASVASTVQNELSIPLDRQQLRDKLDSSEGVLLQTIRQPPNRRNPEPDRPN